MYTTLKTLNKLKQEATHIHVQYVVAGLNDSWKLTRDDCHLTHVKSLTCTLYMCHLLSLNLLPSYCAGPNSRDSILVSCIVDLAVCFQTY